MHEVGIQNPWTLRRDISVAVNFGVWVLEKEGLHVPPFDVHARGNGFLDRAGFQKEQWQEWIAHIVNRQEQFHSALLQSPSQGIVVPPFSSSDPSTSWPGNERTRGRLQALWQQYLPQAGKQKKRVRMLAQQLQGFDQQLWNDLQVYQTRLPSLIFYLIEYRQSVIYPVPPHSLVVSLVNGSLEVKDLCRRIGQQVERLAQG
ncbi:MAG: hypothetical protein J2P36_01795 [Ktedonobacteraceae bacterium]|nr:hypothetical protein [Ktedonobacteraceae bacterium]